MSKEEQRSFDKYFPDQNPIRYHPGLIGFCGSVNAAIVFSQLLYWHGKGARQDWIYKTIKEMQKETGLTKHQQNKAIEKLEERSLVEVKRMSVRGKRHFKVFIDEARVAASRLPKSGKLNVRKQANSVAEKRQTITKSTQVNTTKSRKPGNHYSNGKIESLSEIMRRTLPHNTTGKTSIKA